MPSFSKNQQPRRSGGAASGRGRAGGQSPKHRGYRPEEPAGKNRWSDEDRAARGRAGTDRGARDERRPDWTPPEARPKRPGAAAGQQRRAKAEQNARMRGDDRRFGRDELPARGFDRDERPARRFERDERPARRFDRDERPARRYDRDERPARRYDSDERPARRYDSDERFGRPAARGERSSGRFGRDERPARRFDSDERGGRGREGRESARNDQRGVRGDRNERAPRRYAAEERQERGYRSDERPARRFDRDESAPRRFGDDRRERTSGRPAADERRERQPRESEFYGRPTRDMSAIEDTVLERLEATATTAEDVAGVAFADLGLGSNIVRTLAELGAETPFPIQAATIPDVLAGRNVLGRGRTGSGKTIAFGAPLVERLMENRGGAKRATGRAPRALILAPTRELALQIDRTVQPIARSVGLFTTQIYGGVRQARQVGALRRGVDIVIGTPGRIEDLEQQGHLDLSEVSVVVLDEADHMCDLGFLEPVQRILRLTDPDGQRLLFSATLDTGVAALVDEFLPEPSVHEVAGEDQQSSTIDHRLLLIDQRDKIDLVAELSSGPGKTLVFARTRAFAEQLAEELADRGVPATSLHGDLNQARRTRSLERLTSGKVDVLVATDVAARGIHVDDIGMVIQADAPEEYKTYLHRAGRTGRAGKQGTVVTLIGRNRRRKMEELLSRAEITVTATPVAPGDETIAELTAR